MIEKTIEPPAAGRRVEPLVGRRSGWRLFSCIDCCDVRWIATRDRFSPSSEVCQFCNEIVLPLDEQPDDLLQVDAFCNLVGCPADRVLRSGR